MFLIALVIGATVGWVASSNLIGAVLGGLLGVVVALLLQQTYRSREARTVSESVPVDLAAPVPTVLTIEAYEGLPLAARNAAVARAVAASTGTSPEEVASLLPDLMGRSRTADLATQRAASGVDASIDHSRVPYNDVEHILVGEINLAARMCLPPNDRVRAVVERNFGGPVDEGVMRIAILTTRLPRIDRTIQDLVTEAKAGDRSLAFVVGSIRKMGEYHAEVVAKIR